MNECVFTGEQFKAESPGDCVGPTARKAFLSVIGANPKFKKEVLSEILKDDDIKVEIAKSMMDLKPIDIGLSGPGTFSDFFRKRNRSDAKKKARKATKKVRRKHKDSSK